MKTALAACLLLTAAVLAVPAAHAGSFAHMEIVDEDDDASSFGVCPLPTATANGFLACPGWDFMFCNVDLHGGYVSDTADAILLSIVMRNDSAFSDHALTGCAAVDQSPQAPPGTGDFQYHFFFDVKGVAHEASAHHAADGTWTVGGSATAAIVTPGGGCPATACPTLTLTVPKAGLGLKPGDVLAHLFATSAGTDSQSGTYKVTDRAPSANYGLDYTLANGTAGPIRGVLTGDRPSLAQAFGAPTNATYVYNWTSGSDRVTVGYGIAVNAGAVTVTIATAANQTLQQGTFTRGDAGNVTLTGAKGPLVLTLQYVGFNGTVRLDLAPAPPPSTNTNTGSSSTSSSPAAQPGGTSQPPNGFTFTPHPPTATASGTPTGAATPSTTSKSSPAAGGLVLVAALGAALALVRRRLA